MSNLITDFFPSSIALIQDVLPDIQEEASKGDKFKPLGGFKLIDVEDLLGLVIRLFMHLAFIFVLVRVIYYPIAKRKDFLLHERELPFL